MSHRWSRGLPGDRDACPLGRRDDVVDYCLRANVVGEHHATESGRFVVTDAAVERELVTTPQDNGDTACLNEHRLRSLGRPIPTVDRSPGALHVGDTQGDQVARCSMAPSCRATRRRNGNPVVAPSCRRRARGSSCPSPAALSASQERRCYRPSDTVCFDLLPMGPVHFRGPGDTSPQRLLELHDYGVETRGEVGAVRGARGRANTGGAWSGSQTEVLSRRGRLPRRRPG